MRHEPWWIEETLKKYNINRINDTDSYTDGVVTAFSGTQEGSWLVTLYEEINRETVMKTFWFGETLDRFLTKRKRERKLGRICGTDV